MRTQTYQVNWSWNKDIDFILLKKFKDKKILNFPCGKSKIGIRADIDPSVNPEIIADLMNPKFKPLSYDVLICDPPFSYYQKFKWLLKLSNIAKEYLVICTPCIFYSFKGFSDPEIIATRKKGNLFVRFFFIYKRLNHAL
jgi:hypothetical protein